MRVTIYQPQYFPRLHYFNRIFNSDIFVILDTAQYVKKIVQIENNTHYRVKSYQSDTPIKLATGTYFLTVPLKSGQSYQPINKTYISYQENWTKQHLFTVKNAYMKASVFQRLYPDVTVLLSHTYQTLSELNIATILWAIARLLNLPISADALSSEEIHKYLQKSDIRLKKIIRVSQLAIPRPKGRQKGTEWTAAICQNLKATEYYHGGTAQSGYMQNDYYKNLGIQTILQNWQCRQYRQQFTDKIGFIQNLSILDLLFNEEWKEAQKVIGIATK